MGSGCKKAVIAAVAVIAGFGVVRSSQGATQLIENGGSSVVDGWNISTAQGVSLLVTSSGSTISIDKTANFTAPNQQLPVVFQASGTGATSIDFTGEELLNNTGKAFSEFQFVLQNVGSVNATFDGLGHVFPPGTNTTFTDINFNAAKTILTFSNGSQGAGTTSIWGSANPGDDLLIDAPAGSEFTLKEVSTAGSGGGSVVPLPSAAWQSLVGLLGLGVIGIGRQIKNRRMA